MCTAITDFSKVIELNAGSATAYRERGHAYVLADNFEGAEQDLARSLALQPRVALTFAYRALMYKKQGQPELGAQEIEKALKLTTNDARVLWAKGEIEEALADTQKAAQSYRQALALDPGQKNAEFGLKRLGESLPSAAAVLDEREFGPWRVTVERQRFFATHMEHAKLRVPMEMAGPGQPRILEWEEKGEEYNYVGLLRFAAGKVASGKGELDVEYIALVNMRTKGIVDIIPHRRGKAVSRWTWGDGRVTIAGVDGLSAQHVLRQRRPAPVAAVNRQRRRRNTSSGSEAPWWAPWAQQAERPRRRARRRTVRRRRKPKTLFDLLLGN